MKLTKERITEVQFRVHEKFKDVKLYNMDEDDVSQEIFIKLMNSPEDTNVAQVCAEVFREISEVRPKIRIVSIDTFDDDSNTLEDKSFESGLINKMVALSLLNQLRPVEQKIVKMHFGFGQPIRTNTQISNYLGITEEDLQNALAVILAKLKP